MSEFYLKKLIFEIYISLYDLKLEIIEMYIWNQEIMNLNNKFDKFYMLRDYI